MAWVLILEIISVPLPHKDHDSADEGAGRNGYMAPEIFVAITRQSNARRQIAKGPVSSSPARTRIQFPGRLLAGAQIYPPMSSRIEDCREVELPTVADPRGALTFVEAQRHIPFEIKRVFYIYDVPMGQSRGAHAHRRLHQLLVCLSGSFDVAVDDGESKAIHHLNRPWRGLYIPPLIWASEINFDPGTVCLVLTSDYYDESDHVCDYPLFLSLLGNRSGRTLP